MKTLSVATTINPNTNATFCFAHSDKIDLALSIPMRERTGILHSGFVTLSPILFTCVDIIFLEGVFGLAGRVRGSTMKQKNELRRKGQHCHRRDYGSA